MVDVINVTTLQLLGRTDIKTIFSLIKMFTIVCLLHAVRQYL